MPLNKCQKDGKQGYKWGDSGHCYTGPGAKEKALKQGRAIEISKKAYAEELSKNDLILDEEVKNFIEQELSKGDYLEILVQYCLNTRLQN